MSLTSRKSRKFSLSNKRNVTPRFFKVLLSFKEEFKRLPANTNSARRIQDIKDAGYTIASVSRTKGLKGIIVLENGVKS